MTRVSVIIPTRNRPGPLAECLRALEASFPADAETVVVSDGGDEDLGPTVAPFRQSLRLRLVEADGHGPAAARNRGMDVARGEIAVFTDDDCRPSPGWVTALAAGVHRNPPVAAGGATFNGLPGDPYADAAQLILLLLSRHDRAAVGHERLLASNNIAFPLAELRGMGGFDERLRTAEDREICRRWIAAGFTLTRVADAVVEHDERMDLAGFVRKFFQYGRGAAQFHGSAARPRTSLLESMAFHFHLPVLIAPELRQRGPVRAAAIAGLIVLWELANLAGFIAERWQPRAPQAVKEPAATKEETAV